MLYRIVLALATVASLFTAALPARSATIVEKTVDVEIGADGGTVERSTLRVRIDSPADLAAWSPYAVYFDEQRTIESLTAYATTPAGETVQVPEGEIATSDLAAEGAFRSSSKVRTVRFPAVPPGSVLTVETTARQRSDFRADGISLASEKAPIASLRVTVHGAGPGLRWRISGSRAGLSVQESADGVVVTASALPALKKLRFAPGGRSRGPVLRFAWGQESSWGQVGRWYEDLLASVPSTNEAVAQAAREQTAGRKEGRGRLAALLDFVRRQVRYVAADAAIDGHRPTSPGEVLARQWGDCKDKALLLVAMLRAVGVEAYPALIHLGADDRIDDEFPSPFQFNHVVVAVAAAGVAAPGDPVAGAFLFIDPTQEGRSIRWLHPAVQDQYALVVRSAGSALVRTPLQPELEGGRVETRLTLGSAGDARGETRFEVSGDAGAAFASAFAAQRPEEIEAAVRQILGQVLPGAELSAVKWAFPDSEVPTIALSARIRLAAFVQGSGASHVIGLPEMAGTPASSVLQDRELPVVLTPKRNRFTWHLEIPDGWCPPKPETVEVGNAVGSFRQSVSSQGRVVEIGRDLEIRQRWIEPASFADLAALSAADHGQELQRLRLDCGAGTAAVAGGR
jgi:transglutaminase-like putative cysteine protease